MIDAAKIRSAFIEKYRHEPLLVAAPGRINLIGEHTDYNDGFVLPAAIDRRIIFAVSLREDRCCRLSAHDLGEDHTFSLDDLQPLSGGWPNYLMGVCAQLLDAGYALRGFDCLFGGDIPIGAGLSSSAALECGLAVALNRLLQLEIEDIDLIRFAQQAEHQYAGVQCGIMDQFASVFGRAGQVARLDCRNMTWQYYPIDLSEYQVVLCDSGVQHALAGSEYNTRRAECAEGVALLGKQLPGIASLRDVSLATVEKYRHIFSERIYRRCAYVAGEIERVVAACEDLQGGDLPAFGARMYATHDGLRHLYEVSCAELDFLVDLTRADADVIGSRMMGGGFGGCTINMVRRPSLERFSTRVSDAYRSAFGRPPAIYLTRICGGAAVLSDR